MKKHKFIIFFMFFSIVLFKVVFANILFQDDFNSRHISNYWNITNDTYSYMWINNNVLLGIGNKLYTSPSGDWHKAKMETKISFPFNNVLLHIDFYVVEGNNPDFEIKMKLNNSNYIAFHIQSNMNVYRDNTGYFIVKEGNSTLYEKHYPKGYLKHGKWYNLYIEITNKSIVLNLSGNLTEVKYLPKYINNEDRFTLVLEVNHDTNNTAIWDNVLIETLIDEEHSINLNYSKVVFISDKNWKNILSLSPINYPVFVSEKNTTVIDNFIKKYKPKKLFILGNVSGFVNATKINWYDISYMFFKNESNIYVSNYSQALIAAQLSSLLSLPLSFVKDKHTIIDLSQNTTSEIDELYLKTMKLKNKNINFIIVSKPNAYSSLIASRKKGYLLLCDSDNPKEVKRKILNVVKKLNLYGFYINSSSYLWGETYILLIGVPSFLIDDPVEKEKFMGVIKISDNLDGDKFMSDLPYSDLNNDTYLDIPIGRLPDDEYIESLMFSYELLPKSNNVLIASEYLHQTFPIILMYLGGGMLQGKKIGNILEKENFNVIRLVEHRSNPIGFIRSLEPQNIYSFILQTKTIGKVISSLIGSSIASIVSSSIVSLKTMQYIEQGLEIYYEYDWNTFKPKWNSALEYIVSLNKNNITLDDSIELVYHLLWPNPYPTLNKTNLVKFLPLSKIVYYEGIGNGSVWILPNNIQPETNIISWNFWVQLFENYQYNGSSIFTPDDIMCMNANFIWDSSDLSGIGEMKDSFLRKGVAAFIGVTAVNYEPFSSEITSKFFSSGYSIGASLINSINEFRDNYIIWDPLDIHRPGIKLKTLREFILWGDPSIKKDPMVKNLDCDKTLICNNSVCQLNVSIIIPHKILNKSIIFNTSNYLLNPGYPIIPLKTFEYFLPEESNLDDVRVDINTSFFKNITLPKFVILSHNLLNLSFNKSYTLNYTKKYSIRVIKTVDNRTRIKIIVPLVDYNESTNTTKVVNSIKLTIKYTVPIEMNIKTQDITLGETESIKIFILRNNTNKTKIDLFVNIMNSSKIFKINKSLTITNESSTQVNFHPNVSGKYIIEAFLIDHSKNYRLGPRKSSFIVTDEKRYQTTVCKSNIIINEVMYNPKGSDTGREWIELHNIGNCSVNISNWRLFEGGHNHYIKLLVGSTIIQPDGYLVIVRNGTMFEKEHPDINNCSIFTSSFSLSNSGEEISLKNSSLNIINSFDYTPYANKKMAYGNGKTLEFKNNEWFESNIDKGTPCKPNTDIKNNEEKNDNNKVSIVSKVVNNTYFNQTNEELNINISSNTKNDTKPLIRPLNNSLEKTRRINKEVKNVTQTNNADNDQIKTTGYFSKLDKITIQLIFLSLSLTLVLFYVFKIKLNTN